MGPLPDTRLFFLVPFCGLVGCRVVHPGSSRPPICGSECIVVPHTARLSPGSRSRGSYLLAEALGPGPERIVVCLSYPCRGRRRRLPVGHPLSHCPTPKTVGTPSPSPVPLLLHTSEHILSCARLALSLSAHTGQPPALRYILLVGATSCSWSRWAARGHSKTNSNQPAGACRAGGSSSCKQQAGAK